ncbi:MAG: O-methyltransferase, partial [Firmicutes bacterium]|nr:O-methyltransferase [Bacillota bacterium]
MNREEFAASVVNCEDDVLLAIRQGIEANKMPPISVAPELGRLLTILVRSSGAKRILEIGALGGYSGVCLARGLGPDGTLTSLELNPEFAQFAKSNLAVAGFAEQVSYRVGAALSSLDALVAEGARFDFVFIDADKPNYPHYLDRVLRLANPGMLICADNVLLGDRILLPDNQDDSVVGMRAFLSLMSHDPRLESVVLP